MPACGGKQLDTGYACVAKDGLLSKYRNFLMGWGMRYIKLDRSYLHNFEAKDAPNPSGSLVRGEITRCAINHSFKGAAGPYVFEVVCRNGTTWYMRATSWDEMSDWMIAIFPQSRQELERIRGGTNPTILDFNTNPATVALPPPMLPHNVTQVPNNPEFGVFESEPPQKNPNMLVPVEGESSQAGEEGHNDNCPPSYSDLFDKHDPAVQGKR